MTFLKLYNTLSNSIQTIEGPIESKINFFSCGPTVYDEIHVGNSRPIIVADLIVRILELQNCHVNFMQNITDIDDKIIKRAAQKQMTEKKLSHYYYEKFLNNLKKLNIIQPVFLKISDHIKLQINVIARMIKSNDAYAVDGEVYFDTQKYLKSNRAEGELYYNELSHQNNEQLIKNSAQNQSINKKYFTDFVLWKKNITGIQFNSPWGKGRPGWHTECCALNDYYFKGTLDLHLGGVDLKFPHHENERIQYIALNKKDLARIWIYNGHLNLNQIKISKSIGNTINVDDFIKKYGANILRLTIYNSKYTQPLNFSEELFKNAQTQEKTFQKTFNLIKPLINHHDFHKMVVHVKKNIIESTFLGKILNYLKDNLNTPNGLSELHALCKKIKQITNYNDVIFDHQDLVLLASEFYIVVIELFGFNFNVH